MKRRELVDEQWILVKPLIPHKRARTGRPPSDPRRMLNGIFWILATGAPWRDLPERFGPWQTVYDHFSRWRRQGVFAKIIDALQVQLDERGLIDWELWCVDGRVGMIHYNFLSNWYDRRMPVRREQKSSRTHQPLTSPLMGAA